MTFPLVGKIMVTNLKRTGEDVGKVYAVNTVGNIVGALLPAFVLIPVLGINKGILAMAVVNVAIGMVLIAYGRAQLPRWRYFALGGIAALVAMVAGVPAYLAVFLGHGEHARSSALLSGRGRGDDQGIRQSGLRIKTHLG
jgi:predicted membrane-bound spermidine synthase